jgi:translocator protein
MNNFYMQKAVKIIFSLLISFSAGAIGSIFTFSSIPTWYASLNKPLFNPPNFIFGPAWTMLYIIIGISLFLVWNNNKENKKFSIIIFSIQLLLNALWSIVFFGLKNPLAAMFIIVGLFVSIIITIIKFYKINKIAGLILIPYLLWVSFASILNYYIIILN